MQNEELQCLAILLIVQHLPEQLKNLKLIEKISKKVCDERKQIVNQLRVMANYLEKTHSDVLIADRVGTGVGIGSGVLFIGGLIAAPFTAGLSLGLTVAGAASGVAGGITSVGANITDYYISKNSLEALEKDLKNHNEHLEELSQCDSQYLRYTVQFRSIIEQLGKLSERNWDELITTIQRLIDLALSGDESDIRIVAGVDPVVQQLLQQLPMPADPESLKAIASVCTQIQCMPIPEIKGAIEAFVNFLKESELVTMAMLYTSSSANAETEDDLKLSGALQNARKLMDKKVGDVAKPGSSKAVTMTYGAVEVGAVFKGTASAVSKSARVAAGALSSIFIVIDVVNMVRICQETGETPTVQSLRKMADDLEKQLGTTTDQGDSKARDLSNTST